MKAKKIKIIITISAISIGGAERIVLDIARRIDKEKFAVKILCFKKPRAETEIWQDEINTLGPELVMINNDYTGLKKILAEPAHIIRLIKFFISEKPDIVHTHLFFADICAKLAAKAAGVKHIISTEHNSHRYHGGLMSLLKKATNNISCRIVAVSLALEDYLIESEKVGKADIEVIYNGAEAEKFINNFRDYGRKKVIIGAMGRITEQKGFDYLIKAAVMIKDNDFDILIAGAEEQKNVSYKKYLEDLIGEVGLKHKIKLLPAQKADEFFKKIDIFVLPSRWEGLPLVLLEAGLSGLPVVASNIGGVEEILQDGINGIMVPAGDISALAEAVKTLINNSDQREKIGKNLRQLIESHFTIESMVKRYEYLYERLMAVQG